MQQCFQTAKVIGTRLQWASTQCKFIRQCTQPALHMSSCPTCTQDFGSMRVLHHKHFKPPENTNNARTNPSISSGSIRHQYIA